MRLYVHSKLGLNKWIYGDGRKDALLYEGAPLEEGDCVAYVIDDPTSVAVGLLALARNQKTTLLVFIKPSGGQHAFSHEVVPAIRRQYPEAHVFWDVVSADAWFTRQAEPQAA